MWTMSNGYSRTLTSVAAAGVITMTGGAITVMPIEVPAVIAPFSTVSAPVELTALTSDSSLMDIIGALTGIPLLLQFITSPESPLAPFVVGVEAFGELFLIMPLLLLVGTPLVLLTEGFPGLEGIFDELSRIGDHLQFFFDAIIDWYATHNPFTGQPLETGSSEAFDLSGLEHALLAGTGEEIFTPPGLEDVFAPTGVEDVFSPDGFDAVPIDLGLDDLIA